jgi:DNA-binding IclR family transcriptional regulator
MEPTPEADVDEIDPQIEREVPRRCNRNQFWSGIRSHDLVRPWAQFARRCWRRGVGLAVGTAGAGAAGMGAPILGAAGRGIGVLGQSLTRSRKPTGENSFALLPTFHGRFWQQLARPLRRQPRNCR